VKQMVGKNLAPVIIKRKKVIVSGGHHGGAWKVAYADFVTAMMAFFMLMWLLNAAGPCVLTSLGTITFASLGT
jgi:flagellar motor protein MotB